MKTEEAYRIKSMADQIAEETMEYGITAGLDAYLSYFCEERVSLLDYLKKKIPSYFWMRQCAQSSVDSPQKPSFPRV